MTFLCSYISLGLLKDGFNFSILNLYANFVELLLKRH